LKIGQHFGKGRGKNTETPFSERGVDCR